MKVSVECYQGSVTVNVNPNKNSFSFNGFNFTLNVEEGNKYIYVTIKGSDWADPLKTLKLSNKGDLTTYVTKAVQWISYNV